MTDTKPEERQDAVLVLRHSTDTEQQAFEVGEAMTSRWCPEHVDVFTG